jgi:hypothetical protein
MIPPPIAVGLTVCEKAIVEERTKNVSLINTFTKLNLERLSAPSRFVAHAVLTDGLGTATIELRASRLDTNADIYTRRMRVEFADRLAEVSVLFRVNQCSFPAPGTYVLALLADGDWVAQRRLVVTEMES